MRYVTIACLCAVLCFLMVPFSVYAAEASAVQIWYEDNNLNSATNYPPDLFERYDEENLDQWTVSRSIMDKFYLRQSTFKWHIKGKHSLQQRMAAAHNAAGTTLAYDCTAATWAHYLNNYNTPDFTSTISELRELIANGFVLTHIGLQSVLSKPAPDGGVYGQEWRVKDVVEFMKQVKPAFPEVKIGIICAAPAHGSPYETWYVDLRDAVESAGYQLGFIHVDIPMSYPRTGINGLSWAKLVDIEHFIRNTVGIEIGLVCTDNIGGMDSSNFWRTYVLDGVEKYINAGGRPDALLLFSWFLYPRETIPDNLSAIPPDTATQLRVLREVASIAPPSFLSDPVVWSDAPLHFAYRGALNQYADNPDCTSLIYEKRSGPEWLVINADGSAIGTPFQADLGLNEWRVRVTDENGRFDETALQIEVCAGKSIPYVQSFEGVAEGSAAADIGWQSSLGDYSSVILMNYSYDGEYPLKEPHTQVFHLRNGVDGTGVDVLHDPSSALHVYLDSMVYFVPLAEDDSYYLRDHSDTKMNLLMNPVGNIVAYHGGADGDTDTLTVLDGRFTPNTWRRVTIEVDTEAVSGSVTIPFFSIRIDGEIQSGVGAEGFGAPSSDPTAYTGGHWFRFANYSAQSAEGVERILRSLSFHGQGTMIDDVVVSDLEPSVPPRKTYQIHSLASAGGTANPAGVISVKSGDYRTLVYQADQFNQIKTLVSEGVPVAEATGQIHYELNLFNISRNITNEAAFTFQIWEGDGKTPLWWADKLGYVSEGTSLTLYEGWLLNQQNLDLPFELLDMGVNEAERIYIKWRSNGPAHGIPKVLISVDLSAKIWDEVAGQTGYEDGFSIWIADEPAATTAFYRVVVNTP
jgi:hypothetical protein